MGRHKLIDEYRIGDKNDNGEESLSLQSRFQQFLEKKVEMIANYVRVRWGVKPRGFFNAIELSSVQTSWGTHYILNIIVPHDIKNCYKIERAIVKYARSVFPDPELVNIKVFTASQLGRDADMISVEAKIVMIGIVD